jgi:hypothetical protein
MRFKSGDSVTKFTKQMGKFLFLITVDKRKITAQLIDYPGLKSQYTINERIGHVINDQHFTVINDKVIKAKGISTCHENDEFSLGNGLAIAMERCIDAWEGEKSQHHRRQIKTTINYADEIRHMISGRYLKKHPEKIQEYIEGKQETLKRKYERKEAKFKVKTEHQTD